MKSNLAIRILSGVFFILGIYLLVSVLGASPEGIKESILCFKANGGSAAAEVEQLKAQVAASGIDEPLAYYVAPVKEKNLFTAAGEEHAAEVSEPSFQEKISGLSLQGIISGDIPQAVIEDSRNKQTYFLSAGEYIGEIEVKEILQGRVKLHYLGQETELAL